MINLHRYWMMTDVRGPFASRNGDSQYYIIEMTNCDTQERRTTYATEGYRNFANWQECIAKNWGIYEGIHPHGKKDHLINGDSMPRLVEPCTQQEARAFRETGSI